MWENVFWSENRLNFFYHNSKKYFLSQKKTTVPTLKHGGGGSIMLWGHFCSWVWGFSQGLLNSSMYQAILALLNSWRWGVISPFSMIATPNQQKNGFNRKSKFCKVPTRAQAQILFENLWVNLKKTQMAKSDRFGELFQGKSGQRFPRQ